MDIYLSDNIILYEVKTRFVQKILSANTVIVIISDSVEGWEGGGGIFIYVHALATRYVCL